MFCPNCRKVLPDDANFCFKCGYDLSKIRNSIEDTSLPSEGSFGDMTMTGVMMGTPDYCSPEQLKDSKNVDHRTDIYSLGATFYEMVTGKSPKYFREEHIPVGLVSTIKKAMESNLVNRYQSVLEFIDSFDIEPDADESTVLKVACPKCGTNNPMDVKFCVKCGGDLTHLFAKCPKCEHENRIDVEFCGGCGLELQEPHKILDYLRDQGHKFYNEGQLLKAKETWKKILVLNPADNIQEKIKDLDRKLLLQAEPYIRRVEELIRKKDYEKAAKEFKKIVSIGPQYNEIKKLHNKVVDSAKSDFTRIEKKRKLYKMWTWFLLSIGILFSMPIFSSKGGDLAFIIVIDMIIYYIVFRRFKNLQKHTSEMESLQDIIQE